MYDCKIAQIRRWQMDNPEKVKGYTDKYQKSIRDYDLAHDMRLRVAKQLRGVNSKKLKNTTI